MKQTIVTGIACTITAVSTSFIVSSPTADLTAEEVAWVQKANASSRWQPSKVVTGGYDLTVAGRVFGVELAARDGLMISNGEWKWAMGMRTSDKLNTAYILLDSTGEEVDMPAGDPKRNAFAVGGILFPGDDPFVVGTLSLEQESITPCRARE